LIFAIISDVHANLEAVDACFKRIDEIKPDRVICLGDLVDYCAQPNEVFEIIRSRCDVVVLGNHDEAQFNYALSDGFSDNARISSIHTRTVLNHEHAEYFRTLHLTHSQQDLRFVHASPLLPHKYKYVLTEERAAENFQAFNEKICFIGHSHIPVIYEEYENAVRKVVHTSVRKERRYIINVGSVGQPRDGNPNLCFGVFDSDKFEFWYERVEYNIKNASDKILAAGLPAFLSERLFKGV
jgi:predicted phosphodiesterase